MARIARVVVPDLPHYVTQRGNRREPVFFEAGDYRLYRRLVAAAAPRAGTAVWAYCLMPNHVRPDRDAVGRGRIAGNFCRSASVLHRGDQRSVRPDGPSVPGSLWRGGDGRAAFVCGRALHRAQSGGRGVGEPRRRLAMVERSGAARGRG